MKRVICSFSGGKTSAYMAIRLKEKYPDLVVIFANTGKERKETLDFVNKVDKEYKLGVIWLEAVVYHGQRRGSGYKVVDYETASKEGQPFEEVIKKYGIPNVSYLHCTRELKTNPITLYAKDNFQDNYVMAIGIRSDEIDRIPENYKEKKLFYPLADWGIKKLDINKFWSEQSFNLELQEHQGNCDFCYKKSFKKLKMLVSENPELLKWWQDMEVKYGSVPIEGKKAYNDDILNYGKVVFFRKRMSAEQLMSFAPSQEDMEVSEGCAESCEVF